MALSPVRRLQRDDAGEDEDVLDRRPRRHGYYLEASWRPGGESREYDAKDGVFGRVRLHDHRSAWEITGRISHVDLSSQGVEGGVFDRTSAAVSLVASESLRLTLDYGYGVLKRKGDVGRSQFLTTRVQWELR
jgi:phosphate-selective porin